MKIIVQPKMAAIGGGWALLILKRRPAYIFIFDKLWTRN